MNLLKVKFSQPNVFVEKQAKKYFITNQDIMALANVAQLVGASSYKLKGCRFNSQSGHTPGLWVLSPAVVHTRQLINVSLTSTFLFLPPTIPPLSKVNKHILR